MNRFWLKFWVWTKVVVFGLLGLYVAFFLYNNSGQTVTLWLWFYRSYQLSFLGLIMGLVFAGAAAALLGRVAWKTLRQVRQLRQEVARKPDVPLIGGTSSPVAAPSPTQPPLSPPGP